MQITADFSDYLRSERNRSELTVRNYEFAIKKFAEFCNSLGEDIAWQTVEPDIVREWVVQMIDEYDKKPATVNLSLSALRTYYHFLMIRGVVDKNPAAAVSGPKKPKRLPAFVRQEDMDRLLDDIMTDDSFKGRLKRLVVLLLYSTGMRRAEILSLTDTDVLESEKAIKVTGKRRKQRLIPVSDSLMDEIRDYKKARDLQFASGFEGMNLLVGMKGKNLRPDEISRIVRESLSNVTSQSRRSPHVLRHTFATAMLNNGADLQAIQQLLGHESLETTQIYTHLSFEQLKKEYEGAHPRS